jgi:hypothetical protein
MRRGQSLLALDSLAVIHAHPTKSIVTEAKHSQRKVSEDSTLRSLKVYLECKAFERPTHYEFPGHSRRGISLLAVEILRLCRRVCVNTTNLRYLLHHVHARNFLILAKDRPYLIGKLSFYKLLISIANIMRAERNDRICICLEIECGPVTLDSKRGDCLQASVSQCRKGLTQLTVISSSMWQASI